MKPDQDLIDFNKQILFGEIGSIIGAHSISAIARILTTNTSIISASATTGAITGSIVFWTITRIIDEKRKKRLHIHKFLHDTAHFAPGAITFNLFAYQPTLFFITKQALEHNIAPVLSIIIAQTTAFIIFLVLINLYRLLLKRYLKKTL